MPGYAPHKASIRQICHLKPQVNQYGMGLNGLLGIGRTVGSGSRVVFLISLQQNLKEMQLGRLQAAYTQTAAAIQARVQDKAQQGRPAQGRRRVAPRDTAEPRRDAQEHRPEEARCSA